MLARFAAAAGSAALLSIPGVTVEADEPESTEASEQSQQDHPVLTVLRWAESASLPLSCPACPSNYKFGVFGPITFQPSVMLSPYFDADDLQTRFDITVVPVHGNDGHPWNGHLTDLDRQRTYILAKEGLEAQLRAYLAKEDDGSK